MKDLPQDLEEVAIPIAGQHGNINGQAHPIPVAHFLQTSCSGIVGVLVCGKIQHIRVCVKGLLGGIAMVQIPVHYQDLLYVIGIHGIAGTQGHIIEKTEPHGPIPFCMMSRGPDQGKTVFCGPVKNIVHEGKKTTHRQLCCLIRKWCCLSIRIKRDVGHTIRGGHPFDMGTAVD